MANFILLFSGICLLAWGGTIAFHRRWLSPTAVLWLGWGLVLLLGGLEIVRYSDLNLTAVLVIIGFVVVMALTAEFAFKVPIGMAPPFIDEPSQNLRLVARLITVLVIIGIGLRYYHVAVIYSRPLFDIQQSRLINEIEAMPGTIYSRLAVILFLWPLPAAVLAWYATSLRWWDKAFLLVGSMGQAAFGFFSGGRSGLLITVAFMIPIAWLSLKYGPGSKATRGQRTALWLGVASGAVLALAVLLVMFGLRTSDEVSGGSYSRFADVNPLYATFVNPYGSSLVQEGVLGAVGYGTQPTQRLSLFFDMGVEQRLYGAWNFDVFANLLRRVGIGEEHYFETLGRVYSAYMEAGVPPGTFSTCIRDFYLDFGWPGVFVGGVLMIGIANWLFARVVRYGRFYYLPMLGLFFGFVAISPLFSGLQVAGANLSLAGAVAACLLFKFAGGRGPVTAGQPRRAPPPRPAPRRAR